MRNYIKADLYRIIHKKRRWALNFLLCIVFAILGMSKNENLFQGVDGANALISIVGLIMSLIEIAYVYGDDLKARTMQIAIGSGLPRQKVVHAKWLEFMIVSAFDVVAYALISILVSVIYYGTEGGFDVRTLVIKTFMQWLTMTVCIGCVMFIMFITQGIVLAMLVYIMLVMGDIVSKPIDMLINFLNLTKFHIQSYYLYSMLDNFGARLVLGNFSWFNAIGILVYMMIGFALASILFKKKELEF